MFNKTEISRCLSLCVYAAIMVLGLPVSGAKAAAPNLCFLNWTLPNGEVFSPFGATRSAGRAVPWHAGVDVCMPVGTPVPVIQGAMSAADAKSGNTQKCHIIPGAQGPLHNTNPGGFGFYTRFDCGNGVEVMMAHLNGYSGNIPAAVSGQEGNACAGASGPHVHLEVFIDSQVVDPQCVFGLEKGPYHGKPQGPGNAHTDQCKGVLGGGGALNLCDASIRNALKADGRARVPITRYPKAASYPPENYPGTYGTPQCKKPAKEVSCKIDHSKVPDPTKPNEWKGDPNYNTDEGTLVIDTEVGDPYTGVVSLLPGEPGEEGGDLTQGTDQKPAELPPLVDSTGGEVTSCALDTWVALNNQAVLESRRETIMQRRFIAKSDSVIDYGCLPFYLKKTENEVAAIFSENDLWMNREVDLLQKKVMLNKSLGAMSMDTSLMNAIWTAHEEYKKSFTHPLLGGLENYSENPDAMKCQDMQKVWDAARCQNFPAPDKAFPTFNDLLISDPREFPPSLACSNTGINRGMIDAAKNKATRFDKVKPKFEYLAPPESDCKKPISTGITVHRYEKNPSAGVAKMKTYQDGVCTNAGCSYENSSFSGAGSCKQN